MLAKVLILLHLVLVVSSCNNSQSTAHSENADSLLMEQSMTILQLFEHNNYTAINEYFHEDGVSFSPYAFIDTATAQILDSKTFASLLLSDSLLLWGHYDGSGDPILLSLNDYIKSFIYPHPFYHAESHKLNSLEGSGNSLINMDSIYSNFQFTNHYFSGFNPDYGGMDWQCIRLLYKKDNKGAFRLIAIINDRWTI